MSCGRLIISLLVPHKHRLHAPLHRLRRDVFLVSGHPPEMPEGVFELAGAVAVELIYDRLAFLGSDGQRLLDERIHVLHIEMEAHRRPAKGVRRLPLPLGNRRAVLCSRGGSSVKNRLPDYGEKMTADPAQKEAGRQGERPDTRLSAAFRARL